MSKQQTGRATTNGATPVTAHSISAADIFAGSGEMRERCRTLEWMLTPLGPVESWPASLRILAGTVLGSAFPTVLLWGDKLVQIYNDGYRELMGVKHPAGLGQPTHACWPEVWHLNAPIYERVRAGETVVLEDALFPIARSGVLEDAWFTLSYSPAPDDEGRVSGVLVTVFETTAQIRARDAREKERERLLNAERAASAELRAVLESMTDAVYIGGFEGITLANQAALEQLGFATREELNRSIGTLAEEIQTRDVISGAFIPVEALPFSRALARERVVEEVLVRHRTMGVDRVVRCAAAPVIVDDRVVAAVAVNTDVTEQNLSEAALREAEARFRTVQEASTYGTVLLRPERDTTSERRIVDFRIRYINSAGARLTGKHVEEMIGRTLTELFPATRELGLFDAYVKVMESGEPWEQDVRYIGEGLIAGYQLAAVRAGAGDSAELVLLYSDATARLAAEAERTRLLSALDTERERLRSVILHAPAPLALLEGPEHRFTLVNAAYKRISGGGRDVTGLTPAEAFPELAGSGIYELFHHVYETGEPWDGPETAVRYDRDGTGVQETWFNLRFEPLRDVHGNVVAILNFAVDVTEQVRARHEVERLLVESERSRGEADAARARTDAVLASIADAFYLLDRDWCFTYVNDAAEPLLQSTREQLLGRTLWEAFPGVIGSPFEAPYRDAMENGRVTSAEAYFPPLGTWFDVRTYPWTGGLMVHFRDIGERKAAESEREHLLRELEVERSRLAAVFAQTPSVLAIVRGPDHILEMANAAYLALNGHRDVIGKPLLDAIPELRGQGFDRLLEQVVATGESFLGREVPIWLSTEAGAAPEERFFDFVYLPLIEPDATGAPQRVGVIAHGNDITEQVLARREVERARERADRLFESERVARNEAEAANRAKSEFLAVMSHELRTPLNAIGGYAELMEMGIRGPVTPHQREDLRRVQASQRHLLGLINEVLNYAKLETGTVHFDMKPVQLRDALAEAEALVAPQARAKGLALSTEPCDATLEVQADGEKLRQILVNLLSNAVKFTATGGHVTLSCVPGALQVQVTVHDTGIGIPAEQQERIFDPFVQVRSDLTRPHEGTGLGLAISRDLARGMNGNLSVESALGVGSTFTLTLPRVVDR